MDQSNLRTVYSILEKEVAHYEVPVVDLIEAQTKDPFKILVATILSARTNDRTTSEVCKRLFARVQQLEDLETVPVEDLEKLIFPVGFYRNKARYLKQLPDTLQEKFQGKIPHTVEELLELPGVGRKTANLVVAVAFKKPAICVDIHVHRIMNRLGYLKTASPHETEMTLRKKLPQDLWKETNVLFVAFGQNKCRPLSPFCSTCPIEKYCKKVGVTMHR